MVHIIQILKAHGIVMQLQQLHLTNSSSWGFLNTYILCIGILLLDNVCVCVCVCALAYVCVDD